MRAMVIVVSTACCITTASAQYLGNYSTNPYVGPPAPPQPPGTFTNPYGNSSNSPRLYNDSGQFRGNLNTNPYDPDSVANPYGRYGSPYSQDSINNPYGQGSPYRQDSPFNPYGRGLRVYR
jgi:hypothetical protein